MFVVVTVEPGAEDQVRDALTEVSGLTRSVGFRYPADNLLCVVGLGANLWTRMFDAPLPAHLHPFVELVGDKHTAPSTPGDLLFHLRAAHLDKCFELARLLLDTFGDAVRVVDEVHGFRYFDQRDLLGFVDGTENPEGDEAAEAALIGDEDPQYAGGSYVIVQKYLHDLGDWNAISVEEQERVIGRSKLEDVEMPDDVKPTNSHLALNTIVDDEGVEHDILRDNMPFGSVGSKEFGTYFIGYAADAGVTEEMLRNMFLGKPEGNYDRILDFSTAHTGCLFFVPPIDMLDDIDELPAAGGSSLDTDVTEDEGAADAGSSDAGADAGDTGSADGATVADPVSAPDADGSLRIGGLR